MITASTPRPREKAAADQAFLFAGERYEYDGLLEFVLTHDAGELHDGDTVRVDVKEGALTIDAP